MFYIINDIGGRESLNQKKSALLQAGLVLLLLKK